MWIDEYLLPIFHFNPFQYALYAKEYVCYKFYIFFLQKKRLELLLHKYKTFDQWLLIDLLETDPDAPVYTKIDDVPEESIIQEKSGSNEQGDDNVKLVLYNTRDSTRSIFFYTYNVELDPWNPNYFI